MNASPCKSEGVGLRARLTAQVVTGALVVLGSTAAQAGNFQFGDGFNVDYLMTFNYGLNVRAEKPAHALINNNINGDDGDHNFDRGSLINNRISAIGEVNVSRDGTGFMLRGSTFYDFAYNDSNDNNSPDTINKFGPVDHFSSQARDRSGSRSRLLDAYAYTGGALGDSSFYDVRVGNQVVAWGESLFVSGISAVQGPVDATKSNVPGTEVKEVLLPESQIAASLSFNDWTLLSYYQFKNHPYELSPVGDYFSTTDVVGAGARYIRFGQGDLASVGKLERTADDQARDSGQWGLGVRYMLTANTQLGLYRLRYHDRLPSVLLNPAAGTYTIKYFEDIDLTGASISTRLGEWQVSGELSYKDGLPLASTTVGVARGSATQAQISTIRTWGNSWIAPQTSLTAEVAALRVNSIDQGRLAGDRTAQVGQMLVTFTYPDVFSGWDLSVPVSYGRQFNQSSVGTFGFGGDGDSRASVGAKFKYLSNLEVGLTYNAFLGSADPIERPLADRDFVAFNIKYDL
ncbi:MULTISPECIES: DUF1302 domain-containing protein [unclassified Pseudomonas]|uniref:DUF1302 domain-containing protein n=1 Tax=unclassified Pseudomonas TaxID=196821 RepID=UPI000A1E67C0|nr:MULTISPECIES: DUF1302 family protein [unclassified Pseudomonas]